MFSALIGRHDDLPPALIERWPELAAVRIRRGGLPPRVGGWLLGQRSVAAITLWGTVFLAPEEAPAADLLLHEARHVQQFGDDWAFPVRYVWQSIRHGYHRNRYEADARAYADRRLRGGDLDRGDH
ncbi:MAG: hypothetical protein ABJD07_16080 [Gemmatimonadaceae bacterium]